MVKQPRLPTGFVQPAPANLCETMSGAGRIQVQQTSAAACPVGSRQRFFEFTITSSKLKPRLNLIGEHQDLWGIHAAAA